MSTQASAIAYLELRIAQLMGDLSTEAGNSVVQNLQRELKDLKTQKADLEKEFEEEKKERVARGKFALSVLDENTTRIEGERELGRLRDVDAKRETAFAKVEEDFERMQEKATGAVKEKLSLQERLEAKERDVVEMKKIMGDMKAEHGKIYARYKENQELLLKVGGRVSSYMKDGAEEEVS